MSFTTELPLRLCGLCQAWNRKPCGDGCGFSLRDPTWEQVLERENASGSETKQGASPE